MYSYYEYVYQEGVTLRELGLGDQESLVVEPLASPTRG